MKFQDFSQIKSSKQFPHSILILSKEESDRKFIFEQSVDALSVLISSYSIKTISGENFSLSNFRNEVETQPFLCKHLIVHLINCDKISNDELKLLIDLIRKPVSWSYCFFSASTITAQSSFYKAIDEMGWIVQKNEEKSWEKEKSLWEWLRQQAILWHKKIDVNSCKLIVKELGYDRDVLLSELFKVVCFVGAREEIKEPDILAICSKISQETLWNLGDAIFGKQCHRAVEIATNICENGYAIPALIAHLRSQFHNGLHTLLAYQQGGSEAVTRQFAYLKGNLLDKKIALLSNYGITALKQGLATLFDADLITRNSQLDSGLFLDLLIYHLSYGLKFNTSLTTFSQFAR